MPFRLKEVRDEDGKVLRLEEEQFRPHYLGETPEEAEKMYNRYKGLIRKLSFQFSRRSGVDNKDLFQEGLIGLARAVRDYEPERQVCIRCKKVEKRCKCENPKLVTKKGDFHTFAVFLIRNALREAVYANETPVPVPAYLKETHYYLSKLSEILDNMEISDKVKSTIIEFEDADADNFRIHGPEKNTINSYKKKIKNRAEANKLPYDELVRRAMLVPRMQTKVDVHRYDFDGATEEIDEFRLDTDAATERMLEVITEEEREMLMKYHIEGFSVNDLAEEYGKSKGWISTILRKAREKLGDSRDFIMEGAIEK